MMPPDMRPPPDTRPPSERVDDLDAVLEAFRLAIEEALELKVKLGQCAVVLHEGRIRWLQPHEIAEELARQRAERAGVGKRGENVEGGGGAADIKDP